MVTGLDTSRVTNPETCGFLTQTVFVFSAVHPKWCLLKAVPLNSKNENQNWPMTKKFSY